MPESLLPQLTRRQKQAWVLRLVAFLFLAGVVVLKPIYISLGPVQPVSTQHPSVCMHTRLTDEVEEWKIQRTLQMVRELGTPTIVEYFPWAYIETAPGVFDWAHADLVVRHARAQGLTIIARLGTVPTWVYENNDLENATRSLNYIEPTEYSIFARFVEQFTARYQDDIDTVLIWNEPNLAHEWGYQDVDPDNYIDLLRAATPAARRGNPEIIVLAGALAQTLEPADSVLGMNDLDYLIALYEGGFADLYDMLAVHSYGFGFPPDDPPAPDVLNYRRVELLREVMVAYGDADKPVIITEAGWNDHPRWTRAVRPGQRIAYTIDAIAYAETSWPWVENICFWAFRYPVPTYSYPDYYTFVGDDFSKKPIYTELQAWLHGWGYP
nr:beta-galactosidase [Anaerolineae bacterium]